MAALRNTDRAWGWPAKLLHWLVAAAVAGMVALGVTMTQEGLELARQFRLFQLHKSIGLTAFAVILLRLLWRAANPTPDLPSDLRPWERAAARASHAALYLLLLAMPVTGFLTASSSPLGVPTVVFGVLPVPHPLDPDKALSETLAAVHGALALALVALVLVHAGAALRHHLLLGHDVLTRMLPDAWRPRLDRWRWRRKAA